MSGGIPAFFYRQFFVTPAPADPKAIDLTGEVGIVSGSNVGLGLEIARQLLELGLSTLILAVRSKEKGETAKRDLAQTAPEANIQVWELDMSSYDSIRAFATRAESLPRLDVAILNAGVVKTQFESVKSTGHEEVIQVNYISTALLSLLLIPVLRSKRIGSTPGKLTIIGSEVGHWSKFDERHSDPIFPAFDNPANFDANARYLVSKVVLDFFVVKISTLIDPGDVTINIANPGLCYGSALHRGVSGIQDLIFTLAKRLVGRSCSVGARPLVKAAVALGQESHGQFYADNSLDM